MFKEILNNITNKVNEKVNTIKNTKKYFKRYGKILFAVFEARYILEILGVYPPSVNLF